MKQLFKEQVFDILEVENGFIVVYKKDEVDGKYIVSYKSVSLDNGVVTQRTKTDYDFIKYGEHSAVINFKTGNFITNNCVKLDDGRIFAVSVEGEAVIIGADGKCEWQGTVRYKHCGPSAIASSGQILWASFAEKNALIRFNLGTMREELRIGGSADSAFSKPKGIWIDEPSGRLFVCNAEGKNILTVNMKSYAVAEHASFEEPVYKYIKIANKEFVILQSGLYLL